MVFAFIDSAENNSQTSNTMMTSSLKVLLNFVDNLVRRFSFSAKNWVYIWIIPAANESEKLSKLFIINLAIAIGIKSLEQALELSLLEVASKCL